MIRPLAALLVAVALAIASSAGCGGSDDAADDAFCAAIADVQAKGQALSALDLDSGTADLDETKTAMTDLVESIRAAIEVAPEFAADTLEKGLPLTDDAIERIESADSREELISEAESLMTLIYDALVPDAQTQRDLAETFDECGLSTTTTG